MQGLLQADCLHFLQAPLEEPGDDIRRRGQFYHPLLGYECRLATADEEQAGRAVSKNPEAPAKKRKQNENLITKWIKCTVTGKI